jgi:hypothetical protein
MRRPTQLCPSLTLRANWVIVGLGTLVAASGCGSNSQTETIVGPSATRCAVQGQIDTATFPPVGGSGTVRITTDRECSWSVQSDAAWLVVPPEARGQGEGSVPFTIAANGEPSARSATLSLNDQRMTVSQGGSPCGFELSSTAHSLGREGGQRSVDVDASSPQCTWSATANAPWITIADDESRAGDGTVVFNVSAATGPPRSGTLTVAGQTVTIEQGTGCTATTNVTSINASASGGFFEVPVAAPPGCSWSAASQTPWLTIDTSGSGSGPGAVRVAVAASEGPIRTGSVSVAGVIVTVTQTSGCRVSVSPGTYSAPAAGTSASFAVQTAPGCLWTTGAGESWISFSPAAGSGPAQVAVAIAPNDGPERAGSFKIAEHTIAVTQATRCTWTLLPPALDYSADGGHGAVLVIVTGGCTWTASSTVSWITMQSGTSGAGEGVVQFVVGANSGTNRSGVVKIGGMDLLVRQAAR